MGERLPLFDHVRDALEHANKYRSDGNDRRYQDALRSLDTIELAHEALRAQRDAHKARIERMERDRFVKHGE